MSNDYRKWDMPSSNWTWHIDDYQQKQKLQLLEDRIEFEKQLRKEYPALQEAWEKYQVILNLVKQEKENE